MCSDKLLASKIHGSFDLRIKITKKNCSPPNLYISTWEIFAPPYTSPISLMISYGQLYLCLRRLVNSNQGCSDFPHIF